MKCVLPAIAAKINNEGLLHLNSNRYDDAIASFTSALAVVKKMLLSGENGQSSHSIAQASCGSELLDSCEQPLFQINEMMLKDPSKRHIFYQPVTLSCRLAKPSAETYHKCSFAIMLNLALAHHLSGLATSDLSRQNKLEKALRLYEFAYSVHMQENTNLQVIYTLGIVNNLGHVQEALGDCEKARQCFQHLLTTLMFVMESGEVHPDGEWDVFLHNVTHLVLRDSTFAAAA